VEPLDPALARRLAAWKSPSLGEEIGLAAYGSSGRPMVLFPSDSGDHLEAERFGLVKAVEPFLLAGRLRLFTLDTINRRAWGNPDVPAAEQARLQALYMKYVEEEVVPYVREACGNSALRLSAAGARFGAFHAANALLRRPDLFDTVIAMCGFFDLAPHHLRGYSDDNSYYNNPVWYLPGLTGNYLDLLRDACTIHLVTGQGPQETPDASFQLSAILSSKGIPHTIDLWGSDVTNDWVWWKKMLPHVIEKLGG
jgi:esterase/lipase superfamily enzyme